MVQIFPTIILKFIISKNTNKRKSVYVVKPMSTVKDDRLGGHVFCFSMREEGLSKSKLS